MSLICEHIIVIEPGPYFSSCQMSVSAIQSLANYWTPTIMMNRCKSISLKDVAHSVSEHIRLPALYVDPTFHLSVHESPFQEGSYTVWVYFHSDLATMGSPGFRVFSHKYRLSIGPKIGLSCLRSFTPPGLVGTGYVNFTRDTSYSGYTEIFDAVKLVQRVLALPGPLEVTNDTVGVVELPGAGDYVHLSAYSGALTYSTRGAVFINYYL